MIYYGVITRKQTMYIEFIQFELPCMQVVILDTILLYFCLLVVVVLETIDELSGRYNNQS